MRVVEGYMVTTLQHSEAGWQLVDDVEENGTVDVGLVFAVWIGRARLPKKKRRRKRKEVMHRHT